MITTDRTNETAPPALRRGLDILELLEDATDPVPFGELQRMSGAPPASFGRILRLLADRGYAAREADGRYALGWRAGALGLAAMRRTGMLSVCQPHLEEIARLTEESSEAVEFHDDEFLFVGRVESPRSVVLKARPGSRFTRSTETAIGLVSLAFDPAGKADKRGALSKTKRDRFASLLQNNDEVYRGAAAVFNAGGACVGCLCIAAPAFRVGKAQKKRYRSLLIERAAAASHELGYRADRATESVGGTS